MLVLCSIIGVLLVFDTDAMDTDDVSTLMQSTLRYGDSVGEAISTHDNVGAPLVSIRLEGTPQTRTNRESKTQERTYSAKLLQDHVTLFKEGTKGEQEGLNPLNFMPGEDMFMMAKQFDLSELPPVHIVEFKPLVTRKKGLTFDDSIVHHIDVYLCTDELADYPTMIDPKSLPAFEGRGVACDSMPWAYDRDARALVLPDLVGVAIGKGTPYKRLALEWHYLLARDGTKGLKHIKDHITDHSGIELIMTPDMRKHSIATFGVIDGSMRLPPGEKAYDFKMSTAGTRLDRMLGHDLGKYGELHPIASHLHMHAHGRKMWIEHERDKKKVGEFGHIGQYKGFGVDQSFFVIDEGNNRHLQAQYVEENKEGHMGKPKKIGSLKAGDELTTHCIFDTTCKYAVHDTDGATSLSDKGCEKATEPIKYGLSHGQEMCGILMMYYPHDPSARFSHGNVLGYASGDLITTEMPLGSQFMAMAGRASMMHGMAGMGTMERHHQASQALEDIEMPQADSRVPEEKWKEIETKW